MVSEGAEKNDFQNSGGQFNVPEKLSFQNFKSADQPEEDEDEQEDQVLDGIYTKTDEVATSGVTATPAAEASYAEPEAETKPQDLVERYDPTKPMALLKLFGDLIITHEANTLMKDTRLGNAPKEKPPAPPEVSDEDNTYNGNEKTQLAFASLEKSLEKYGPAQSSEVLDRVMQTLDRLTRQTRGQFDNSEIA